MEFKIKIKIFIQTAAILVVLFLFEYQDCFSQIISNQKTDSTNKISIDSTKNKGSAPGPSTTQENFKEWQNANYKIALQNRVPISSRLDFEILNIRFQWENYERSVPSDPITVARKNLLDNLSQWMNPSGQDIVQNEISRENAFAVPHITTLQNSGLKIPFSTFARLFGIEEDVSPQISYEIKDFSDIEVVVYSIQAVVVATLFKGTQPPDSYTLSWNGRDDEGRRMIPGDYIMEVRIGNERYVRKRIIIK